MAMSTTLQVASLLSGATVVCLLVVGTVWLRNYRTFRTPLVLGLVGFAAVLLVEAVGLTSGALTATEITTWYATLEQPALTPPNWVFGPVWTLLYALMGVSLALVWRERESRTAKVGIGLFALQLALNFAWSLVFFGGSYSHAAVKRPEAGDFRVQEDHGGSVAAETPSESLRKRASEVVDAVTAERGGDVPLYARVDGIERDRGCGGTDGVEFRLLEVELIEPELFFRVDPDAGERLADALLGRL